MYVYDVRLCRCLLRINCHSTRHVERYQYFQLYFTSDVGEVVFTRPWPKQHWTGEARRCEAKRGEAAENQAEARRGKAEERQSENHINELN